MDILRTPDDRFTGLPGYDFRPNWTEVTADDGTALRLHHLDVVVGDEYEGQPRVVHPEFRRRGVLRERIKAAEVPVEPGAGIVLTGGASQLAGVREVAVRVFDRPVRLGRPRRTPHLADVKPFGKQELLARISAVMRRVDLAGTGRIGGPDGAPGVLTAGSLTLEPARHEARVGAISLGLTPTEFRLLEALVRAGGDLVAHHRLARAGWPAEDAVRQTASDSEVKVKSRSFIAGIIITNEASPSETRTGRPSSSMLLSMITGDSLKRKFFTGCLIWPFSM